MEKSCQDQRDLLLCPQLVADDLSEKTVLWRLISLKEGTDL